MPPGPVRILVSEDYEPFRTFLCSTIQNRTDWRVIGEVVDGIEAVHKAKQLLPDLVVLDIGLPTLNGIEAARRIRVVSPNSKILFVSQELSADIVNAALETGAHGYVNKIDAGSEVIIALEAVLRGQTYLSTRVAKGNLAESLVSPMLVKEHKLILNQRPLPNEKSWCHEVGFYVDDRSLWHARIDFIREALKNGNAAVLIASESHHNDVLSRLQTHGVDVSAAIEWGRYIAQDVAEALSSLMVNDMPDPVKFSKLAGALIANAAISVDGDPSRVFVCGEGTTLLWEQGNEEGVVRLEHLWDEMARTCAVKVHCGYVLSSFHGERRNDLYGRICAEHSVVLSR
jgi:DNA-binding NarL/FixJ family response regulator